MGLISKAALAGYILEETLAHLIRNNGYRLINGASEDPDALMQGGHGLLVRGRGASHQADVLGELDLPSPFALPVRLFVEAKHRREKSDLRDVRNAHGVISDVNEHYATVPAKSYRQPLRRFQYRYALFSTSGFRSAAQTFALAQQISLIDLSGPAFAPLRRTVDAAAQALLAYAVSAQLKNFPIRQMRLSLRGALSQNGAIVDSEADYGSRTSATELPPDVLRAWSADVASDLEQTGVADSGLLLGFPPAPFVLVMRPDAMSDVERYVDQYGSEVRVEIHFDRRNMLAGDWTITPQSHPDAFALRFGLPGALERWLLTAPGDVRQRAMQAKIELLSSISVFLNGRLIRLLFVPVNAVSPVAEPQPETDSLLDEQFETEATDASDSSELRETLLRRAPERAAEPPDLFDTNEPLSILRRDRDAKLILRRKEPTRRLEAAWTVDAAQELTRRLERRGYLQAAVLRAAALEGGGTVRRNTVLQLMGRRPNGSLNGITKPTTRIATNLKQERLLAPQAKDPLMPRYAGGVAKEFEVPPDLVAALKYLMSDAN